VIIRACAIAARVSTPPITIVSGSTLAGELSMRSMYPNRIQHGWQGSSPVVFHYRECPG
jgi:hypothetical protein